MTGLFIFFQLHGEVTLDFHGIKDEKQKQIKKDFVKKIIMEKRKLGVSKLDVS